MLRRLTIKGFESHENSTFEFKDGMNLIQGVSDSGKSSVIRAISLVAYNRWDEKMLRVGHKYSEVYLESDRGCVLVRRGSGKNEWAVSINKEDGSVEELEFEKVGRTVPPEVTKLLGMPKLEISDVVDVPNVMFQLDKHYMMAEVDGKKSTGNMIAQIIDGIVGLGGIERLIKDISTDGAKSKKKMTENNENIESLKEKLHDEEELAKMKETIDKCRGLREEYREKDLKKKQLKVVSDEYDKYNGRLNNAILELKKYDNLDRIVGLHKDLVDVGSKYNVLKGTLDKANALSSKKTECEETISELPNTTVLEMKMKKFVGLEKRYRQLKGMKNKFDDLKKQLEGYNSKVRVANEALDGAEEAERTYYRENPNCPTCGKIWSDK